MSPAEARILDELPEVEQVSQTRALPAPPIIGKNMLLTLGAGTLMSLMVGAFKLGILWSQQETTIADHEKRIAAVEKMQTDVAALRVMVTTLVEEKKAK